MREILELISRKGAEGKLILYEDMERYICRLIMDREKIKDKSPALVQI